MSRIITLGEIMGRLATPGKQRFRQAAPGTLQITFAGAEASAAVSIAHLGGRSAFVSALPQHEIADACVADLRSFGVQTQHILRTEQGRLGLYFLESGANQRPGRVIYDRDGSAMAMTPPDAYDWDAIFADASWLLVSGITPAISRNAAEVTRVALEEASRRNVQTACDMNYRAKLWRWEPALSPRELAARTMRQLLSQIDLLICGRDDAEQTLGIDAGASWEALPRSIVARYPRIRQVAMTLREGVSADHNRFGGLLYDKAADRVFYAPEEGQLYSIAQIVDRLGAGDAFTAGLLFALETPELCEPAIAVAFAAAAGCLAHSVEGDFNWNTREEIEALMQGDASGRVKR